MFRPRIVPVLLLKGSVLVKSVRFSDHKYIGDPINAARIFNEHRVDELCFLDIDATRERRTISLDFVRRVGEETRMPFAVGGGLNSLDDIRSILKAGAEKVVIGTRAGIDPEFVRAASQEFGASTISICLDVRERFFKGKRVYISNAGRSTGYDPIEFAQLMQSNGAGELIVQSYDRDGCMAGYDIELVRAVSTAVTIPVVALGGAGSLDDMYEVHRDGHASACAAGSIFVYAGKRRGVLINYPDNRI